MMNKEKYNAYMRKWNKQHYHNNLEESRKKARDWYHKNKNRISEKRKELSKAYRKKHPEKIKEYNKSYWESNKDIQKEKIKTWRESHKVEIKVYQKEYYEKNPHKRAEYERTRRAKKAGCWGNVPSGLWKDILNFYGNICLCCGTDRDLTQDHVTPLSKGGKHDASNLQPLCGHCNYVKNNKTADYMNGRIFS